MKATLPRPLVMTVLSAALLGASGCSDSGSDDGGHDGTPPSVVTTTGTVSEGTGDGAGTQTQAGPALTEEQFAVLAKAPGVAGRMEPLTVGPVTAQAEVPSIHSAAPACAQSVQDSLDRVKLAAYDYSSSTDVPDVVLLLVDPRPPQDTSLQERCESELAALNTGELTRQTEGTTDGVVWRQVQAITGLANARVITTISLSYGNVQLTVVDRGGESVAAEDLAREFAAAVDAAAVA